MRHATIATRILARLAAGTPLRWVDRGWVQGRAVIAEPVVLDIVREGFGFRTGDEIRLTELGRTYVERLANEEFPNRWIVDAGRAGRHRVTRNLGESPLGWLLRRSMITEVQFVAGERLRTDFQVASRPPSVTMRWEKRTGKSQCGTAYPLDPTESQIAAKQRLNRALKEAGPGLEAVLVRVVCLGEGLEPAERALGWPARAGKVVLGIALDRLALHYRLPQDQAAWAR